MFGSKKDNPAESTGRTAIVTGGTRGIGGAISRALQDAGHSVIAVYYRNDQAAEKFQSETGIAVTKFDVGDFEATHHACQNLAEQADDGGIDILVNNAGITRDGFLHKMTFGQWDDVIRTNLTSVFNTCRALTPAMRDAGWGRVINISSINGQKGQMGQTNYSAAKAGIIGFTKSLAQESARKNITVNTICPGYIETSMTGSMSDKVLESIKANIPLGRLGQPDEIAKMVAYLASEEAGFITGATLKINGGQYM